MNRLKKCLLSFAAISLALSSIWIQFAYAALKIDINQGNLAPMPIAIAEFTAKNQHWSVKELGRELVDVVVNDLESSGLFKAIDRAAFLEAVDIEQSLNYSNWRRINAVAVVGGDIAMSSQGQLTVTFKIWDCYSESVIDGVVYRVQKDSWRRLAHKIADKIYQRMTGEQGYFDTRILFVATTGKGKNLKKHLAIMDQDGANHRLLTDGNNLVLTPRFDPSNHRAIYVSYKKRIPHVYLLDIEKGWQRLVGKFSGISFAPRFAPDGRHAVMSVAQNGSTNIFEIDLATGRLRKLTHDIGSINTSPCYSPDGLKIVFNSDRAGSRQLYVMDKNGANITRVSRGVGVYASPVWSPRGDFVAFTKIEGGVFYIGVMRPDGSGERLLTSSWLDEAPAWSPNGRIIMFSRQKPDGSSFLHSVDVTGYNEKLVRTEVRASDPAWSNLLK